MIKIHKNNNRYYLTKTGLWVRDFTRSSVPEDINKLIDKKEYDLFLSNEMKNASLSVASIDAENMFCPNVVIVSDGFDFESKQHILKSLPQNKVTIIGTNRSLVKWARHTRMDWYIVNNPYKECLSYLPNEYYPRCIISTRTNPNFVIRYKARRGVVYKYIPVSDNKFSSSYFSTPLYYIDDYRNPICAAIGVAFRWEVQKLLLFCCDDSFKDERPGAEQLDNGMWMYPQHKVAHGIIDGLAYWMTNQENIKVKIADYSMGPKYDNIPYIKPEEIASFFA